MPCRTRPKLVAVCTACVANGSRHVCACAQYLVLMDKRPGAPKTLGELLGNLYDIRPFGGLAVSWVLFGSSGHKTRPKVRFCGLSFGIQQSV